MAGTVVKHLSSKRPPEGASSDSRQSTLSKPPESAETGASEGLWAGLSAGYTAIPVSEVDALPKLAQDSSQAKGCTLSPGDHSRDSNRLLSNLKVRIDTRNAISDVPQNEVSAQSSASDGSTSHALNFDHTLEGAYSGVYGPE
ncbi:hypothetical protein, partial [Streptomyces sp. NPDC094468]|uniref:hypothetical protein n=1 Tax=Streptomyces sp. NPDC094468 TaxID=3366066 RepID=UPI00380451D0